MSRVDGRIMVRFELEPGASIVVRQDGVERELEFPDGGVYLLTSRLVWERMAARRERIIMEATMAMAAADDDRRN